MELLAASSQFGFEFGGGKLLNSSTNRASIVLLFFSGCPPKVIGRVITVIIDAIKRAVWWRQSNIKNKVLGVVPAFTDNNSTTSVVFIRRMVRVVTTSHHIAPSLVNSVKRLWVFGAGIAMTMVWISIAIASTSARTGIFRLEVPNNSSVKFAAVTLTQPINASFCSFADWFNGNQSTKTLFCDIKWFAHWTAPNGSREVTEPVLIASVPLRTIAGG
jgi:hypothetical protein